MVPKIYLYIITIVASERVEGNHGGVHGGDKTRHLRRQSWWTTPTSPLQPQGWMRAPASVLNNWLYFELEFPLVCLLLFLRVYITTLWIVLESSMYSPFQMISCVTTPWSGQCPVQFTQVGHLGQVGPKPRKDLKKHKPLPEYSSNPAHTKISKLGRFKMHRTWFTNSLKKHTLPVFFPPNDKNFEESKSSEK